MRHASLTVADPEIAAAVAAEEARLNSTLLLIASENFPSRAVMEAAGTPLVLKYAEGYPPDMEGAPSFPRPGRYYGGCEQVDTVERIACARAIKLFGAEHANVQPNAGAGANLAAYTALLKPGDTILSLALRHGGHLSHGAKVSATGQLFNIVHYELHPETHRLDMAAVRALARQHKPRMIVAGHSAYPREVPHADFREIADEVGAFLLVDMSHYAGLVAGGVHDNPVPHADVVMSTSHKTLRGTRSAFLLCRRAHAAAIDKAVFPGLQGGPLMHLVAAKAVTFREALQPEFRVYAQMVVDNARTVAEALLSGGMTLITGGTDNHLVLMDMTPAGLTGSIAQQALERVGITANMNSIPYDPRKPNDPSGLRLGTAALTTRGMGPDQMRSIAGLMLTVLRNPNDEAVAASVRGEVAELCEAFPIPGWSDLAA